MERHTLSLSGRERIALLVVVLVFLVLAGGLIKLQVIDHSELAAQSENNRIRVVPIVPQRGRVFDREHRVIIDNRPSYTVSTVAAEEKEGITLPHLAELIDLDTAQIRKRIGKNIVSRYQPAPIRQDIPFEVVAVLEEQNEKFPGVSYQMERVRQYRSDLGAEPFTGYVGEVSRQEMDAATQSDLRLGSMIGKKGLERRYDQILRGREGTQYIEVNASGQIGGLFEGRPGIPAVAGGDLILSVDNDLQLACVQALDTFCCGAIVAMDPRSGEILGMTSYPGFDANIFSSVIPESLWAEISTDSTHPLLNRPLTGLYPPGSTVKFITVGAGLEEGVIAPGTLFKPCLGGYRFGNRVFHCWDLGGHGALNAVHALEQSCDIYMYQLGLKLGIDVIARYLSDCGFGRPTGIDLPGEAAGLAPDSKYYDERYGKGKWTQGLILNNSIGQGEILVTPLQLTQFFCGLANGGVVYRPHLVKRLVEPSGRVIEPAPVVSFKLPFRQSTLDILTEGLRLVVEGEHGTARSLRNKRYSVGGKTGTAQNPHGLEHSWFVGVAPL
ncbi:MAG: penicillin-binding protein 2, partial [candidate division Zixibacteria bacterium]|nr:penicillin-binding protein 2 [candidate division Zixibacteria bacterium]